MRDLRDPQEVTIETRTTTADNIRQRYWIVGGGISKLEALTRLLEAEPFDAMLVFARTKKATDELAEKISALPNVAGTSTYVVMEAVKEVVYQLRLRNIGGIIIIPRAMSKEATRRSMSNMGMNKLRPIRKAVTTP